MGGARASVCGRSGRFCQACAFSRPPVCCTDVGGDESGGCFSAAAGQPHYKFKLYLEKKYQPNLPLLNNIILNCNIIN